MFRFTRHDEKRKVKTWEKIEHKKPLQFGETLLEQGLKLMLKPQLINNILTGVKPIAINNHSLLSYFRLHL